MRLRSTEPSTTAVIAQVAAVQGLAVLRACPAQHAPVLPGALSAGRAPSCVQPDSPVPHQVMEAAIAQLGMGEELEGREVPYPLYCAATLPTASLEPAWEFNRSLLSTVVDFNKSQQHVAPTSHDTPKWERGCSGR